MRAMKDEDRNSLGMSLPKREKTEIPWECLFSNRNWIITAMTWTDPD
jgi:hypothetical protein